MGLGSGVGGAVSTAVRGAGAAVDRLDRILSSLETLGGSIASIEHDMRVMRSDLREAVTGIEALRTDVQSLEGSVGGIRDATVSLEQQVVQLGASLKRIDSLVPRLGRRSRAEAHTPPAAA